jgi:hypothetical protein
VRIEIGPMSSASARAWIGYAAEMLTLLRALPEQELRPQALDGFASLLAEWRPIAEAGDEFRWSSEEPPERAEYLINAHHLAGTVIERETAAGRAYLRPAAAYEFHFVLVHEVLEALENEGGSYAQFVGHMRNMWGTARRD